MIKQPLKNKIFKNIKYYRVAAGKDHHLVAAELVLKTEDKLVENKLLRDDYVNQERLLKEEIHSLIYEDYLLQDITEAELYLGQLYSLIKANKDMKDNEMVLDLYQKISDSLRVLYTKVKGEF